MNQSDYTAKMEALLEDSAYRRLKHDPTTKVETRIALALKELEQKGHLSTKQRLFLAPSFTSAPQIYGLPKVHKEGTPLRPIASAIGSSTHQLARELVRILKPLSGTTDSYVKDSSAFVERISQTTILKSDVLVSFDVVSLFTRVPVDEPLDVISELLLQDETLPERTTILAPDLCRLIELCLKSTYFRFGDTFYEQVEGAAMGSPLSPIVANLYMETFEKRALDTSAQKPNLWIRYVDDVFAIWPHGDQALDEFLTHLNSQHPAIQFTMEKEEDQKIAFLDVQVERRGDSATTLVFRKKTHTNQYINYNSHHHNRTKSGVIQCLATRAEICHPTRLPQERQHLKAVFQANGYLTQVIIRSLRKHPKPPPPEARDQPTLHLPYVKGVSERIERVCRHLYCIVLYYYFMKEVTPSAKAGINGEP